MCTEWVEAAKSIWLWICTAVGFTYFGFILGWYYYGGKVEKSKRALADRDYDLLRAYDRIAELDKELDRAIRRGPDGRLVGKKK